MAGLAKIGLSLCSGTSSGQTALITYRSGEMGRSMVPHPWTPCFVLILWCIGWMGSVWMGQRGISRFSLQLP
jgi:hypothetical protein